MRSLEVAQLPACLDGFMEGRRGRRKRPLVLTVQNVGLHDPEVRVEVHVRFLCVRLFSLLLREQLFRLLDAILEADVRGDHLA